MDTSQHTMAALFSQLGLDNSRFAIEQFIEGHFVEPDITLCEADFWTPAQSTFIECSLAEDGDWSEVIDQLDTLLRK